MCTTVWRQWLEREKGEGRGENRQCADTPSSTIGPSGHFRSIDTTCFEMAYCCSELPHCRIADGPARRTNNCSVICRRCQYEVITTIIFPESRICGAYRTPVISDVSKAILDPIRPAAEASTSSVPCLEEGMSAS